MLKDAYPYYLAGEPIAANTDLAVTNKATGEEVTRVARADGAALERAIGAAADSFDELKRWPAFRRKAVLTHVIQRMQERHEEFAHVLAVEAGKLLTFARGEITRGIDTFTVAAEEATRQYGEWQPLDISERAAGCQGLWKRVPLGPCAFITPFNFPVNLAAHKIAPALAIGCPFVLKPASATPISSILLGEILAETDLPRGAFSILPCKSSEAEVLVTDDRLRKLSFTGSPEVGWSLKAKAGKKKVTLELGGNAGCIVDADADIDYAAERIVFGAFYQSGQSCISVQRILAHRDIYESLRSALKAKVEQLVVGDPLDDDTFIGPLITEDDAKRVETWVQEAVDAGAKLVVGGTRSGPYYDATILEDAPANLKVNCREIFGPVATLQPFENYEEALRVVNDSDFGLQAGIFTRDIHRAFAAYDRLDVGGVVINDVPSLRVDSMPYGGTKDSGMGREGVRFAIDDMTEVKVMVLKGVGSAGLDD
jgi:acyl-CoA reductase-like NAD-dependent aldehyde dehydrogenase